MKNLNEQESKEKKEVDNKYTISAATEPNQNKNQSQIRYLGKIIPPKSTIIKAMDIPKQNDSYLVKNSKDEEEKPSMEERIEAFERSQDSNKSNISNKQKQKQKSLKINQKPKVQNKSFIFEKLPCAFCSIPITFQQMQNHHKNCKQAFTCNKCKDIFPIFLLYQHENVCNSQQKRKKKSSYLSYYQNKYGKQEDIDEEQEEFNRQHPGIDSQILTQYWKEPKYEDLEIKKQYFKEPQYSNQDYEEGDQSEYYNDSEFQSESSKIVKGLKDYQIQDLITDFYRKGQNKQQDECTICTKQKIQDQIIIRLPCFHTFHKECLVPWLQVKATCPSCKYSLKSK